jgi:hypothetical protein
MIRPDACGRTDRQTGGYSDANSRYSCVITRLRWVIYFVHHCSHIRAAFYPRKAAAGEVFFFSEWVEGVKVEG